MTTVKNNRYEFKGAWKDYWRKHEAVECADVAREDVECDDSECEDNESEDVEVDTLKVGMSERDCLIASAIKAIDQALENEEQRSDKYGTYAAYYACDTVSDKIREVESSGMDPTEVLTDEFTCPGDSRIIILAIFNPG